MEHQKYQGRRVAIIRVAPYLAAYARKKFEIDPKTGGIRIPDSFDLYHCVWQLMERRPHFTGSDQAQTGDPLHGEELAIWLPARRGTEGMGQKNPAFWNWIPPRKHWIIEKALRRLFNWEFHYWCEQQVEQGRIKVEAVRMFIRLYGLGLDCEDALLKNLQRHERTMKAFLGITKSGNHRKRKI